MYIQFFPSHSRGGCVAVTDGGGQTVPVALAGWPVDAGVDAVPVSPGAPVLRPGARAETQRH